MRFYEAADTLVAEQDQFDRDIKDFTDGKTMPIKFRAIRVAHGVYEQRQNDTYMIRIRCAAGRSRAAVPRAAGRGFLYRR